MPAKATILYLAEKYKHETQLTCYHMDILKAIADPSYVEPLPRYAELIEQKQSNTPPQEDYGVQDVIDMFRGKGKLVKGGRT